MRGRRDSHFGQAVRDAVLTSYREDIATVYLHGAAIVVTQGMHGNRAEARPETALLRAAAHCQVPAKYVLPELRDALGLPDPEFARWHRHIEPLAGSYVLRAIAHALYERDI